MSDYHILQQSQSKDDAIVAFHVAIPDTNNAAGLSYRAVLVEYLGTPITSRAPWIDPAVHGLTDGSVYEHVETVMFSGLLTPAEKSTIIEDRFTTLEAAIIDRVQTVLQFWGWSGDV
jgi:hypothetical protein